MPTFTSTDGTTISYSCAGHGPALVLVGGALDEGTENASLIPALSGDLTVFNYVRRGRGDSGNTLPYSLTREIEDLDGMIAVAGGSAHVFGSSSGGTLALEAAAAGCAVGRLAVYDPPYSTTPEAVATWQQYVDDLDDALAAGDRGRAIELFMTVAGLPPEAVAGAKASPFWPHMLDLAPTLAYDAACLNDGSPPVDRLANVTQQVLVLTGQGQDAVMSEADPQFFSRSADAVVAALPDGIRLTVPAAGHAVDAAVMAPVLIDFFSSPHGLHGGRP